MHGGRARSDSEARKPLRSSSNDDSVAVATPSRNAMLRTAGRGGT